MDPKPYKPCSMQESSETTSKAEPKTETVSDLGSRNIHEDAVRWLIAFSEYAWAP